MLLCMCVYMNSDCSNIYVLYVWFIYLFMLYYYSFNYSNCVMNADTCLEFE